MEITITTKRKEVRLGRSTSPGWEARCGKYRATAHSEWLAVRKVLNIFFNLEHEEEEIEVPIIA